MSITAKKNVSDFSEESDQDSAEAEHVLFFEDLPYAKIYPDRDVVIFDGDCKFCLKQVRRLKWADGKANRLSFVSLHDPFVAEHYPELTHQQMMEEMYVIDTAGNRYSGAKAFRYLTRKLPVYWILAPILHIPFTLPLWQLGYRIVASHRYRIAGRNSAAGCKDGSCDLHLK